jgi:hypothetical protein
MEGNAEEMTKAENVGVGWAIAIYCLDTLMFINSSVSFSDNIGPLDES